MTHEQQLIKSLYVARMERREAKKELIKASERLGKCQKPDPCYDPVFSEGERCKVCIEKQPIWRRYKKASVAAGVALRQVIAAGKKLSTEETK